MSTPADDQLRWVQTDLLYADRRLDLALLYALQDEKQAGYQVRVNIYTLPSPTCSFADTYYNKHVQATFTELFSELREELLFQAMVASSFSHEFLVRPLLHNCPLLYEDDVICLLHSLQLMSHHEDRPTTRQNLLQHLRDRSRQRLLHGHAHLEFTCGLPLDYFSLKGKKTVCRRNKNSSDT